MQDYHIDRLTLNNAGLTNDMVDSLYRSYFVHIVGYFNILDELVNRHCNKITTNVDLPTHKTKSSLISALWKVYSILMEYAF